MKTTVCILAVSLIAVALSPGCFLLKASQTDAKTYPFFGNSCIFDSDPLGDIEDIPKTVVGWNFGGDAGMGGSDTRSIQLKSLEDGAELVDNTGYRAPLVKDRPYILRVRDFALKPTGGPYPVTRAAKLYWAGGVDNLQLELTTGTDWPLEDFLYTAGPATTPNKSALTGYMFDVTSGATGSPNDGFCVTFRIEGNRLPGMETGYDAQIRLNPDTTAPGTPRVTFAYDFDDLDFTLGTGELQIEAPEAVTIGPVTYQIDDTGQIQVTGLLPTVLPSGTVTNPSTGAPVAFPIGTSSSSLLPDPPIAIIVEGSLSGSRLATIRFARNNGNTFSVLVSQ